MPETPAAAPPKFTRALSGFGVVILALSVLSPGVSIFVSGASIVQIAGTGAVAAFALGTLICYCQTAMSAELGSAYPTAGYDAGAIGHAIGPWAGATAYLGGVATLPLFLALPAGGIGVYLQPLFPGLDGHVVAIATLVIVTGLSMLNIRSSEWITGAFMAIEVAALLLVAGLGLWHIQPHALHTVLHPQHVVNGAWAVLGLATLGLSLNNASWSLAGASQALLFCEDMKNPRTIGRVIMITFAITALLECAPVIGTVLGAQDPLKVLGAASPFEELGREYLSDTGLKLVSLSIAFAIFNAILAGFIGNGRNLFALARTRMFGARVNRALLHLIPGTDAPWVALLLIGAASIAATWLSTQTKLLLLSGNFTITTIGYVWGTFAGRRSGRTANAAYKTPFYPLIPVLGVGIIIAEVVVLMIDADVGRPSLFICLGVWGASYLYYRLVLSRRPEGWSMVGPADIDAMIAQRAT